jgi:hypothetical protein
MKIKTLDQIYESPVFNEYKNCAIEHCLVYITTLNQYALVSNIGILFDDYQFVENIHIFGTDIQELNAVIQFIDANLGPTVKITQQQPDVQAKKNRLHLSKEEILESKQHFKRYKNNHFKRLFWSEKFEKYYLATEKGIMFEDGVFYPTKECLKLQANLPSDKTLKVIHEAKSVLGWDQINILD